MRVQWVDPVYTSATSRILIATVLAATGLFAQSSGWRHVGNSAIDRSLAGLATGPVGRVWFSDTGTLRIQTASGRVFETSDLENWLASSAAVPPVSAGPAVLTSPEPGAHVRVVGQSPVIYAFGKFVYRSENGGASWDNLTSYRGYSIIGEGLNDMAVSPADSDRIVVAGADGVFRSADGGKSWSGLNQSLPNLPAERLLSVPVGDRGARIALADGSEVEWAPGQKIAWTPVDNTEAANAAAQRQALSQRLGLRVTAVATSGQLTYAGLAAGVVMVSEDKGATWRSPFGFQGGAVEAFWVDPNDARVALAVFGSRPPDPLSGLPRVHVVRTENGGLFWDDFTSNLPDTAVHGIVADRASGAIYAATDQGVFMAYADLSILGIAPKWQALGALPGAAMDVKLDAQGNQLWIATDGYGIYAMLAPHRLRDPRVVSTADWIARATAPGGLVSVLGLRVSAARAGDLQIPVLTATDSESQLQIPFEAGGSSLSLSVDDESRHVTLPAVPLEPAAPAIFVDRDGSPVLLDGDSGTMLDALHPVHSNGRIQVLATGLGRVKPDWPTGLAAPLDNPPSVIAPVTAYLDRQPVEVTRAVLAPYIGFYMVEINVPKIVNAGPAELYLDVNGQTSNHVRVYIEP